MDLFNNYDEADETAAKIVLQEEDGDSGGDCTIEAYMYNNTWLSHVKNYIHLFWKKEFSQTDTDTNTDTNTTSTTSTISSFLSSSYNPFASWSLSEVVRHNMGLKDNTLCVQVVVCDVPIGFCCVLLLDEFDRGDRMSPFSHEMYHDSAVLYNFVLDKPFRGNGYGTKLLQATIRYMRTESNYKHLTLYVDQDNVGAIKLYEKHHFVLVGDNPTNPHASIYRLTF